MDTLTRDAISKGDIFEIIASLVNSMNIQKSFHKTVDSEKYWDGTMHATDFRKVNSSRETYECYKMLTFGSFMILCHLMDRPEFSIHYSLSPRASGVARIRGGTVSRYISNENLPSTVSFFRHVLKDKIESLVQSTDARFSKFLIGSKSSYGSHLSEIGRCVGRLRVAARLAKSIEPNDISFAEILRLTEQIAAMYVDKVENLTDAELEKIKCSTYLYMV